MHRRGAISFMLGSLAHIDRWLPANNGCALLLDVASRQVVASNGYPLYDRILVPPGSTLKPISLAALVNTGRLPAGERFVCPQQLVLAQRRMDCSHPPIAAPMGIDTALAYSCNCFTAHAGQRFAPGELARYLQSAELAPGRISIALGKEDQQLQALGEADVLVTPLGLAHAYRHLALQLNRAGPREILDGLEEAVEFGTGRLARVEGGKLAGKTGSTRNGPDFVAWFAGFYPSRAPKVVVVVMLAGRHGASDAAPIAGEILNAWRTGHL